MRGTVVDVHVLDDATAETVLGEHTFYHLDEEGVIAGLDVLVERLLHEDLGGRHTLSAGIAGVAEIFTVGHLLAGKAHFVGIDDDYIVAALYVGRVAGLVLTAQNQSDGSAETSEYLIGSINDDPLVVNAFGVGGEGFVA